MPTDQTEDKTQDIGEDNNANPSRCNFAFWNISHAAHGQERKECVNAIIRLIMDKYKPVCFGIGEYQKKENNVMTNYKPVCFGIGEYQKKENNGIHSLDYRPPEGYSLITSHAIGPGPNNTSPVALIYKNDIFGDNNSNIVKTGGNERSVTLKNAIISGIGITISTFHYGSKKERNPNAYLSSISPDSNNSYNNVLAFGDWNAKIDPSATDLIHSYSNKPPPVFLQREITYEKETLDISPPLNENGNQGVKYTRIAKEGKGNNFKGTYAPGTWLDVFFLKHDKVKAVTLTHLTYSDNLIQQRAFGKSKSKRSTHSVAPSDHLPIIIEVEFNS